MSGALGWIRRFIRELRRRRVIRVAVVYAGTAFVMLQLGEMLVDPFWPPSSTLRMVTFLLAMGFPPAIGLAWIYNLTGEEVILAKKENTAEASAGGASLISSGVIGGAGRGNRAFAVPEELFVRGADSGRSADCRRHSAGRGALS